MRLARLSSVLVALLAAYATLGGCAPSWPDLPSPDPGRPPPQTLEEAFSDLSPVPSEARLVLLSDNTLAWAARWDSLAHAEESIDAVYFILDKDIFGLAFLGHLYKKASEQVEVRLLVDARGTERLTGPTMGLDYLDELVATRHADVHVYNPPLERTFEAIIRLSIVPAAASNHDKIIIVDHRQAIMGGRNIAANYFASVAVDPRAVIDTDVLIQGERAIGQLDVAFASEFHARRRREILADPINLISRADELLLYYHAMDAWLRGPPLSEEEAALLTTSTDAQKREALRLEATAIRALGHLPDYDTRVRFREHAKELVRHVSLRGTLPLAEQTVYDSVVHVLDTRARLGPRTPEVSNAIVRMVQGTQREILVESPYFILTKGALAVLKEAGERGVNITLLTNSPRSSDNALSQAFFLQDWPEILAEVPNLRVFVVGSRSLLHAKRAVFDDTATMVGTYNLDPLSYYVNSEVVAAVWSDEFAARNRREIEERLQSSDVFEYRIVRDHEGKPMRYPPSHPLAGEVMVAFGPRDHCDEPVCDDVRRLQGVVEILQAVPGLDSILMGQ